MAEQAWRPRPCVTQTGDPGRLGFPSALTMKGCLQWLDAVRMKGVESRLDQRGVSLPCPDPEDGPGVEDATSGAPEGGVPARHAAPQGADYEVAPFGAPLPHCCEGQGKGRRQPRASPPKGPMNHACLLPETARASAGCLTC